MMVPYGEVVLTSEPPVKDRVVVESSPTPPATGVWEARNAFDTVYFGLVPEMVVATGISSTVVVVPTSG
jgi:hypothetical protein